MDTKLREKNWEIDALKVENKRLEKRVLEYDDDIRQERQKQKELEDDVKDRNKQIKNLK